MCSSKQISLILIVVNCLYISSNAAKLPAYIKPCSLSDPNLNECALQSARNAFSFILKGDKSFKIASLAPLKLDQVVINVGSSLEMKLNNLTITGIDTGIIDKIEINQNTQEWILQLTGKHLTMTLTYDMKGRLLLLPIVGQGPGNITLENPIFTYKFKYDFINKHDTKFINILKSSLTYKTTRMVSYLENLFNGDERLGNAMNTFLNENWEDANVELGPSIAETMNSVVTSVIESYFKRVPLKYLFTI